MSENARRIKDFSEEFEAMYNMIGNNSDAIRKRLDQASSHEKSVFGLPMETGNTVFYRRARDNHRELVESVAVGQSREIRNVNMDVEINRYTSGNYYYKAKNGNDHLVIISHNGSKLIIYQTEIGYKRQLYRHYELKKHGFESYHMDTLKDNINDEKYAKIRLQTMLWEGPEPLYVSYMIFDGKRGRNGKVVRNIVYSRQVPDN
jgi:hypothetical protein